MPVPRFEGIDPLPDFAALMENIILEVVNLPDINLQYLLLQQIFELFYQFNVINPQYLAWIYTVQELVGFRIQNILTVDEPVILV